MTNIDRMGKVFSIFKRAEYKILMILNLKIKIHW